MFGRRRKKPSRNDRAKEAVIKDALLESLKESVKVLQAENKNRDNALQLDESTARFCSVLEALFIHGLKETFLGRLSRWGGGELSPRMPEPSFWTFSLVFSHKQVISSVERFSQITTEVGRSRAWLRLALNDGLLGSYLLAMVGDKVSLSVHYEHHAFLRDGDRMDLVLRYITGIEVFAFNLPTNVSLLNRWLPEPLSMAGMWTAFIKPLTDTGAVDAAAISEEVPPIPNMYPPIRNLGQPTDSSSSFVSLGLLNEDEALRYILQSKTTSGPGTPALLSPTSRSPAPSPTRERNRVPSSRDLSPTPANLQSLGSSRSPSPPSGPSMSSPVYESSLKNKLAPFHDRSYPPSPQRSPSPESCNTALQTLDEPELPSVYDTQLIQSQLAVTSKQNLESCSELTKDSNEIEVRLPSEAPSLEWEEDFPDALKIAHGTSAPAEGVEKSSDDAEASTVLEETVETIPSSSEALAVEKGVRDTNDISESNDSSCTCSTEGPRSDCAQCSNLSKERISLTEFVLADPGSRDLIGQEGERAKRRIKHNIGFRERIDPVVPEFSLQRRLELVSCLDIIPREVGLDTQDWRCIDCTKAIGAVFGAGRVCSLTKQHYCEDCHDGTELAVIPPRLLFSWDGKPYPVAKSSLRFLQAVRNMPMIHLRSFNPTLPSFAPAVDAAKKKRKKLTYLSAYIAACPRAAETKLQVELLVMLRNREYLINDTETYSFKDLEDLYRGELTEQLRRAVLYCLGHVDDCIICAGRGFICEICQEKRPVYPFNLDTTSQCQKCCTVFHSKCTLTVKECPRCERLASRSLNQLISETKLNRQLV